MKKIFLITIVFLLVLTSIGCRRRRPRQESIDLSPKRDIKIVDDKKESIIIKDEKVSRKDAKPVVEVEKPELNNED
ncbi:MAG: hypothetical protein C0601_03375 [Candidatus Muiribacterium halophilum]|uniref:Uncharacterized protein n=1 Tax=Muiribacterium halophilum TaxID=2053465 RepID=A0A2N5ZJV2_MUIH1|nr:MAG: hypothetical protein C0601_03375 [Candidatus Muirbacterium halophilum]